MNKMMSQFLVLTYALYDATVFSSSLFVHFIFNFRQIEKTVQYFDDMLPAGTSPCESDIQPLCMVRHL